MNIYEEIKEFLKVNNFKTKEDFIETVSVIASYVWNELDTDHPSNVYKASNIEDLPKTKEDVQNKVAEIKSRNAGSWEPYMIMKEIYGVDLIETPDVNIKNMPRKKLVDAINNAGIFRRVIK